MRRVHTIYSTLRSAGAEGNFSLDVEDAINRISKIDPAYKITWLATAGNTYSALFAIIEWEDGAKA
jgi:hypothetical protein